MSHDERFTQDAIDRLTPVEPSAQLQRMVAQIPITHERKSASWWPFQSAWMPSFAMVAACLVGIYVGQAPGLTGGAESGLAESQSPDSGRELALAEASELEDSEPSSELESDVEDLLLLAAAVDSETAGWQPSDTVADSSWEVYQ